MMLLCLAVFFVVFTVSEGDVQSAFKPQCRAGICDDRPECPRSPCRCIYPSRVDCNVYYQCINGKPYQYRCSPGLAFNFETLSCDYNSNVNCSVDGSTASTTSKYASTTTEIRTTESSQTHETLTTKTPTTETQTIFLSTEDSTMTDFTTTAVPTTYPPTTEKAVTTAIQTPSDTESTTLKSTRIVTTTFTPTEDEETSNATEIHITTEKVSTVTIQTPTEKVATTTIQTPSDTESTTLKSTTFTPTEEVETSKATEIHVTTEKVSTSTIQTPSDKVSATTESTKLVTPTEMRETSNATKLPTTIENTSESLSTTVHHQTESKSSELTTFTEKISSPPTTAFPSGEFACPSRFGLFPDPKSCFRFYHCSHWVPYHKWCPSGLHFNPSLRVCDWPYRAGCVANPATYDDDTTTPFPPKPDNTTHCDCDCCELPVPGDCKAYILCIDGVAFEMTCANGLYFNPMTGTCDVPENMICDSEVECPEPFGRFPYPHSCSHFLDCRNGEKSVKKCPDGLNFDSTNETCSWTGSCRGQPDPPALPEPTDPAICNGCSYCFKRNQQDCARYIKCSNTEAFEYQCATGLVFNPTTEVCDHDYNVICPEPVPFPACPSKNGYFPYPGDCGLYLHCVSGTPMVKQCSGILHFDPKKKHCDWPWAAGCRDNESHPSPEPLPESECDCDCCIEPVEDDCRSFVLCINHVAIQRSCSSGLLYNPLSENCDFAENIECEDTTDPERYECPEYQGLFPHPDDCKKFIHCAHDFPYVKDCPANLHFNPNLKVCDWPNAAGCEGLPVTQPPPENPDFPCDLCNSCFIPNENDCSAYTYCINGTGHQLRCSGDLVFNPEIEACDLLENVNCPNDPYLECPKSDGLFPVDVCTKFLHCSNGIPYIKDCPDGLHFNQVSLVCDWPDNAYCGKPSTKAPPPDDHDAILNQTCNCECCLLPNKYNCSQYFLCLNGILHQGQCAEGLLFNPLKQNCDLAERVSCNELSPLCTEPNGLFSNPANCSTFFRCISGVSHFEQCHNGEHFNAETKQCLDPCRAKCEKEYDCKSSATPDTFKTTNSTTPSSTTTTTTATATESPVRTRTETPSTPESTITTKSTIPDTIKPTYLTSTTMHPVCENPNDRIPVEGNCSSFLSCDNNTVSVSSCPDGLHFGMRTSLCEHPCEAKCDSTLDCSTTSSVTPTSSSTKKPATCNESNGFYPLKDDCTSFYLCSDNQEYIIKCPQGLHFSAEFHVCEHPCDAQCDKNITCPSWSTFSPTSTLISTSVSTISPLCEVQDGVNGVDGDCTSYYLCTNGNPYLFKCPDSKHFSEHSRNCEEPCVARCDPNLDCSITSTLSTEKITTISPHCLALNGLYPAENCESFYLCSNGQEHLIRCPPGLHYSKYHETCEQPCDAKCNTSIDCTPSTTTTPSTTIQPLSPQCAEQNGLFQNAEDCETFYQCSNGRAHLMRCPSGLHFSPDDELCERPCVAGCNISVVCPTEIPDVAGNCTCNDCFLPDPTDCSAYYFCNGGHLTKGYCPYGMLFSKISSMCNNEDDVDCEATGDPSLCPEPYGTFPYPGNCRKFLHCEDSIAHIQQCEEELEFDPETGICSKSKGHCGSSTIDPHCSHANGLFPHTANCSLFYHCENGAAYLKHCTPPLVFNSQNEVCDWPNGIECGEELSSTERSNVTEQNPSTGPDSTIMSSSLPFVPSTSPSECQEVPGVICPCACRVPTYDECNSFYQCQEDGTACKKFCPEGLYFNKRTMVCDLPSNVECRDFFFTTMRKFKSSAVHNSFSLTTPYKKD